MSGPTLRFGREECADLEKSLEREWLETNGLGGFASSTISGIHTRRYHGLLTAATKPPVGRMVLLAKLEETLVLGDRRFGLSANSRTRFGHTSSMVYHEPAEERSQRANEREVPDYDSRVSSVGRF